MNNYKHKANIIFLIDSLGAFISAFFLGVVLVHWEHYFGMPQKQLYALSFTACGFALFSLTSYLLAQKRKSILLKTIAFANLIYSVSTAYLMFRFYNQLTKLGFIYFLLEIAVIILLVVVELKVAYGNTKTDIYQ